MSSDDAIIELLKEIRDNQRDEIAWRKKVTEQSMRMQRSGLRWQRIALLVGGAAIGLGILFALYGGQWMAKWKPVAPRVVPVQDPGGEGEDFRGGRLQ